MSKFYKGLEVKENIYNMNIGDVIPCRYTAPLSGRIGYFSELGNSDVDEIDEAPITPDGKFYFIKVDKDKLIADRNIQSSISWSELNKESIIDGKSTVNSIVLNGTSSYVRVPLSNIKNYISNNITIMTKVYRSNWHEKVDDKILSCTHGGGFTFCYNGNSRTISLSFLVDSMPYVDVSIPIFSTYKGWLTFYASFNGTTLTFGCVETNQKTEIKRKGNFKFGTANYLLLGAEPGEGTQVEDKYRLFNGKVSEFRLWNECIDISEFDSSGENLVCSLKSENSNIDTVYDTGLAKAHATINNCTFDYNDIIFTIPNGGVAYNDENDIISNNHLGYGAWPIENDWDKYICNGILSKDIEAGDNNIWNYSQSTSLTKCIAVPECAYIDKTPSDPATMCIIRGYIDSYIDNIVSPKRVDIIGTDVSDYSVGFRPMLIVKDGE